MTDYINTQTTSIRGFLRLPDVLERFPVSRSRWYAGIKNGEYPAPVKISANISAWRSEEIEELLTRLNGNSGDAK